MKKIGLFLLPALATVLFTSCKEKEYDGADSACIATVHTMPVGTDYYFEADTGQTIYPSDKSRIGSYEASEGKRAVISFKTLPPISGYNLNAKLYSLTEIYTGAGRIVSDAEELATLADSPILLYPAGSYLTRKYLTLYVNYPVLDNSKHRFELIVDDTNATSSDPNYLDVQLRHDAGGEVSSTHLETYISFSIDALAPRLANKRGIKLRVKQGSNDASIRTYPIDLPQTPIL